VNLNNVPVRDPIRNLVNCAQRSDVHTVIEGGKILIEDGRVLNVDEEKLVKDIQRIAEKIWKDTPDNDPEHRTVDDFSL
jgi:cytosine/adenosine deaminase-related metal-dependent hydrolase